MGTGRHALPSRSGCQRVRRACVTTACAPLPSPSPSLQVPPTHLQIVPVGVGPPEVYVRVKVQRRASQVQSLRAWQAGTRVKIVHPEQSIALHNMVAHKETVPGACARKCRAGK